MIFMQKIFIILIVALSLISFIFIDAAIIEPNFIIKKEQSVYIPNWNRRLNGFKVAIISDLHAGSPFIDISKIKEIIQKTNKQNPDLIVILGDLDSITIQKSNILQKDLSKVLKNLHAKYGVVAILGNHDYQPSGIVKSILKNAGITVLENSSKYIYVDGEKVKLVGFKDLWHYKSNPKVVIGIQQIDVPIIVLSHNPDLFPEIPNFVSLTLSGHTHGGEIIIPFIGSPFIPSKYGQRFRKGYIVENNKHLYVSGGIATTSRFRFCNPPEIVFLKLYKQEDKNKIVNTKPIKGINKNYIPIYLKYLRK